MSRYVVAATNVPAGRFGEIDAESYDGAWFAARHLSKTHAGVSFGAYEVSDGEGSILLASFLNGERRFKAAHAGRSECVCTCGFRGLNPAILRQHLADPDAWDAETLRQQREAARS